LKAIDLYSGIGGWSLGLKLAGVDVVSAYEIWPEAVETYNANLSKSHKPVDVRKLSLDSLPSQIDLVVGSPPCTEFSFSNRGGGGDLAEGLKDIVRFLQIVDHLRPRYWILENVPRIAPLIRDGLKTKGHPLFRFRHLKPDVHVVNFASFGLPQSRHRCLVGHFPFEVLDSYKGIRPGLNLGNVVENLNEPISVNDPVWGYRVPRVKVSETEPEPHLDTEQLRMNREAKLYHPVYNDMSFPDRMDVPARTVTATCTRVSRESIVIKDPANSQVRRLTVRERASLQSFPITYQFLAKSHSSKVKMIGNAVPPLFSFMVGMASHKATSARVERKLIAAPRTLCKLKAVCIPNYGPPHKVTESYPEKRRFRAAIPGLRFKSGMRFELANEFGPSGVRWRVRFFYGPSTDIRNIPLDGNFCRRIATFLQRERGIDNFDHYFSHIKTLLEMNSAKQIQDAWTHRRTGVGPFEITDLLGRTANLIKQYLEASVDKLEVSQLVLRRCGYDPAAGQTSPKIVQHSYSILAGFVVGSFFNQVACEKKNAATKHYNLKDITILQPTAESAAIQHKATHIGRRHLRAAVHVLGTPSSHRLAARPDGAF
jgi:DNA (cytosine-5)-methyltransferase 1